MKKSGKKFITIGILTLFIVGTIITLTTIFKSKVVNKTVTKEAIKEEIKDIVEKQEYKVTFIELGSVNCIPCKMMQPVMKKIEENYKSEVNVIFYDVWTREGEPYGQQYAIQAIPTQIFLDEDGKEFYRHTGFFDYNSLEKILKMKGVGTK